MLDTSKPIVLVPGLPVKILRTKLREANRATNFGHRILAFYLHDMELRGLYQLSGHASAVHYADDRLGISERSGRELVFVGGRLLELPKVDGAFFDFRLSWSKARLLAEIVVPQTQAAWIERAQAVNCRILAAEVRCSEWGQPPRKEDKMGLPPVRFRVVASLDPLSHELWEKAKQKLSAELGGPQSDADLMRAMAELVLATKPDGTVPGREAAENPIYTVVIQSDANTGESSVLTDVGPVRLDAETAARISGKAEHLHLDADAEGHRKDPTKNGKHDEVREPDRPKYGQGRSDRPLAPPTSPSLRRAVLARDRHRCLNCGSQVELNAHHRVFRSLGGPTTATNLLSLCIRCHALVHAGFLRIKGGVPDRPRFFDKDDKLLYQAPKPQRPFMRILGRGKKEPRRDESAGDA